MNLSSQARNNVRFSTTLMSDLGTSWKSTRVCFGEAKLQGCLSAVCRWQPVVTVSFQAIKIKIAWWRQSRLNRAIVQFV